MGAANLDAFKRQTQEVREIFGDLEIIEAKTDFIVYVTAEEQETSVRGDPNNCMFATACKRAFGSKGVLFYPTVAYVDMLDPNDSSRRIVMRFRLPTTTRKKLEDFDAVPPGGLKGREATFILKAVPKTHTLAAQAKHSKRRRRLLQMGKAEVSPTRSEGSKKGHQTRRAKALMGVRSGAGQIHTREG